MPLWLRLSEGLSLSKGTYGRLEGESDDSDGECCVICQEEIVSSDVNASFQTEGGVWSNGESGDVDQRPYRGEVSLSCGCKGKQTYCLRCLDMACVKTPPQGVIPRCPTCQTELAVALEDIKDPSQFARVVGKTGAYSCQLRFETLATNTFSNHTCTTTASSAEAVRIRTAKSVQRRNELADERYNAIVGPAGLLRKRMAHWAGRKDELPLCICGQRIEETTIADRKAQLPADSNMFVICDSCNGTLLAPADDGSSVGRHYRCSNELTMIHEHKLDICSECIRRLQEGTLLFETDECIVENGTRRTTGTNPCRLKGSCVVS